MYKLQSFIREKDGSVLLMAVPFLLVIILLAGGFIDFGRGNTNRAETLGALDAAALAAAIADSEVAPDEIARIEIARRYYDLNLLSMQQEKLPFEEVVINISENNGMVEVRLSGDNEIGSSMLQLADIDSIDTSASTAAGGGGVASRYQDIDVVLVADTSTSMNYCHDNDTNYCAIEKATWHTEFPVHEPIQKMAEACCEAVRGIEQTRGHRMGIAVKALIEQVFPEDDAGNRIELPTVRMGMVTFDNTDEIVHYGVSNLPVSASAYEDPPFNIRPIADFPGPSLRNSYADAIRFTDDYIMPSMLYPARYSGATCGKCGIDKGIALFNQAPTRPDGKQNSPVKTLLFIGDGWMTRPKPPGYTTPFPKYYDSIDPVIRAHAAEKFIEACKKAKKEDIIVYTIAFGPDIILGSDVYEQLQECASEYTDADGAPQKHFYVATDGVKLKELMATVIPGQFSKVRIMQ